VGCSLLYYARFADHAVDIGRRVVFLVTGVLPPDSETDGQGR
jgi:phosphate transport system protein